MVKSSRLCRCVKGTLKNMPNVVGFYGGGGGGGGVKSVTPIVQHGNEA